MPSRSLDDKCSAVRLYLYAWRVRKRFPHTNATFERNNDANASSEEAMVDVEIDRYIDEHSVSNLNYSLSTLPRLKPADRDNLKLPSHAREADWRCRKQKRYGDF